MIEAVFIFLILLVCAYAVYTLIPHPIGLILAVVVGLLAVYVLVVGVVPDLEHR